MKRQVTIYTDGGAEPNPGPGGWGVVLIDDATGTIKELSGGEPETTNNRMELTAACAALEALTKPCEITLYTDSNYLKQGVTRWLPGWIKKGWQRKRGGQVKNVDLWKRLATTLEVHNITWEWVKGHAGNTYNERADQLASAAIRSWYEGHAPQPDSSDVKVYVMASAKGSKGTWAAFVQTEEREYILWAEEKGITSNSLFLIATVEALGALPPGSNVNVYTTNDYIRHGASKWIKGWRRRDWKKKSGEVIANVELWQMLDEMQRDLNVDWPDVKSDEMQLEMQDVGQRVQEHIQLEQEMQNYDRLDDGTGYA